MSRYLNTLISEKGIDREEAFMVAGPSGQNHMAYGDVVDAINRAPLHEQRAITNTLRRIDFLNGDIKDYLRHLAQAIAL